MAFEHVTSGPLRDIVSSIARAVPFANRRPEDSRLTLTPDRIPWSVEPTPDRVVAVGDLHGDLVALASILHAQGLVDDKGRWKGGRAHLVLTGDLVGNHEDCRLLMEFVMRLEQEAEAAGGALHPLLGNHDIICLSHGGRRPHPACIRLLERYAVPDAGGPDYREAFRGYTPYARWLRGRNAILRIGNTLFAHAGVNQWLLHHHPGRVNSTIRAWIRHWQGTGSRPDDRTGWTVGQPRPSEDKTAPQKKTQPRHLETGPLWTRIFKPPPKNAAWRHPRSPEPETLRTILSEYEVTRLVIGHIPVRGKRVQLTHPCYGEMVVMIDTRISDKKCGGLSCIEFVKGQLGARSFTRTAAGKGIRRSELRNLRKHSVSSQAA